MEAFFLRWSILSLYTSFNSLMSLNPSLFRKPVSTGYFCVGMVGAYCFAFLSNFSLYFSIILSPDWVAKNRTSCTCAHRLCVARRYGAAPDMTWRSADTRKLAMMIDSDNAVKKAGREVEMVIVCGDIPKRPHFRLRCR